ncbi:hypothetical protein HMPREF0973_02837 [Prevotella veroralis F0319]|uniref:Uncharacterized protein n=2 Tax=Prevotella veroralis TaxID=28137 RepID=C9MT66_9BACT|nr:hypothetical protein HMPREF0973_02837 [Prevotella veroralis F0319]
MDLQPTEMVLSSGTGTPLFFVPMLKIFQTMEADVKMELVPTTAGTAVSRVEAVNLSGVTKNLIKCRAMVSDLWECVVTSYAQTFPETNDVNDNTLDTFKDLCGRLGIEIMNLTSDVMEATILDTNFKEI